MQASFDGNRIDVIIQHKYIVIDTILHQLFNIIVKHCSYRVEKWSNEYILRDVVRL